MKLKKDLNIKTSRRTFLKKLWAGLGIVAAIEVVAIGVNFLFQGRKDTIKPSEDYFIAGPVKDFAFNTVTPFRRGHFYLARLADGGFLALSLKCTHLGCSVSWDETNSKFVCPCHSSMFEINGNVISPPAPNALDTFPVIIETGIVKVNTNKKIERKRFQKEQETYSKV